MDNSIANTGHRIVTRATDLVEDVWYLAEDGPTFLVRAAETNQLKELTQLALVLHSETNKGWVILPNSVFEAAHTIQIVTSEATWQLGKDKYLRPRELKKLPGWEAKNWYDRAELIVSASKQVT